MERKTFIAGGIVGLLVSLGAAVYYSGSSEDKLSKVEVAESEGDRSKRLEKEKKLACEYLQSQDVKIPKIEFNKHKALNGMKLLLDCAARDFSKFESQHKQICEFISEGLKKNSPKWRHPLLYPFYADLYEKLCTQVIPEGDGFQYLRTLKTEIEKKLPILDPNKNLSEVCSLALDFVRKEHVNIESLVKYILSSRDKIKTGSHLEKLLKENEDQLKKEGGSKTLETYMVENLGKAVISPVVAWSVCKLPIEKIIEVFSKTLTKEEVLRKRKDFLPLIVEIIDLVVNDNSEKGKEVLNILVKLATDLSRLK